MANLKKILIIDDDLTIRFVLKKILTRQLSNVDIFSSEDGVQGVGYAFVLRPDLIIIDSTLPKYSGRELVDFISSNDSFKSTPIILLHEDDSIVDNLPSNFIQRSKASKLFPEDLVNDVISEIGNVDDEPHNKRSFKFLNFLSRKIISYSNSSFINARQSKKGNAFRRLFNSLEFLFNQILSGFYLTLFYMLVGRKEAEVNIEQKKKDESAYRARIYPAVGASVAITLFIVLHLFITLGGIFTFGFFGTQQVAAASYTWDGGGVTNNWSDCDNWSTNICPVSVDSITFNATSTKNATIDAAWTGTVNDITIASGYTGTITQQRSLTISSTFTISDGIYTASNQSLSIGGAFTMNTGSTFTASSLTTTYWGGFTINGGTFNHNNGTISLSGGNATLNCNNVTFNLVTLASTGGTKTINSNCSLPLGNNPSTGSGGVISLSGTLSGTGTLTTNGTITFNSGSGLSGFTGYSAASNSNFVIAGATLDFSTYTTFSLGAGFTLSSGNISLPSGADLNSALTISGGTFNAPSGNMFVAGALTISGSPTFNHNNGTVTFDGTSGATLSCNNIVFNSVVFTHSANTKTINSNCTLPLGNNPTVGTGGNLTVNGLITGSGTLTMGPSSNLFFQNGGNLNGFTGLSTAAFAIGTTGTTTANTHIDLSGYTFVDFNSTFTMNSATNPYVNTFTAPSSMTVAGNFTLNTGTQFNHNNGSVTFDGVSAILSCNNVVFNQVNIAVTGSTATKTVNSNCNLPVGNSPTISSVILNGTLTGSGTLTVTVVGITSTLTLNSGASLVGFNGYNANAANASNLTVAGANIDFSSYISFTMGLGTLTLSSGVLTLPSTVTITGILSISGGTFNAPSGTMTLGGNLTVTGSPTFNHNNGTIVFNGSTATLSCGNVAFNLVSISGNTTGIKTVSSNCSLPLGNNPTIANPVTLNGTLSGIGTLNIFAGCCASLTLTLNSGSAITGFSGFNAGTSPVTVAGGNINLSTFTSAVFNNLTVNSGSISLPSSTFAGAVTVAGGTLTLNGTNDFNSTLALTSGTLNATSGNMTIASHLTFSGSGIFNHNNGTVSFDSTANATLSCNNVTFNLAVFAHTGGTKTVSSNCNLPLGNNPSLSTAVVLHGTLTGTGTITGPSGFTFNAGAALSGFSGINATFFTVSGATIDLSSLTTFSVSSTATVSSGSVTLPNNADFNSALTISGGTFNAPSGSIYLGNSFTISGSGVFNHNNGTIVFDGTAGGILTCNSVTLNLVRFEHTSGGKTVSGSCSLPLGNNPTIPGPVNVSGTLSGSGILTGSYINGAIYSIRLNGAASLTGFTGLDINRLEQGSANTLDLGSYSSVTIGTLNTFGGSNFTAPSVMTIKDQIIYISGTFNHNNGTIILSNADNTIQSPQSGTDLTLYNLKKEVAGTLTFPRYSEFSKGVVVQGTLTLKGTSGNLINLRSSLTGSPWNIDVEGPVDIEYLTVQDSNNIGNVISAAGRNITDLGNNTGWSFNAPGITNVGPSNLTNGSFTTDNTPTITFDISDLNVSDTVQYTVQMDNSSDFATPEVNYTSSLESQGSKTYTVATPLLDGEYYMRIRGLDQGGGIGGYNVVNSGNVAFKVDATAPTATLILGHVTDSTNPNIYIISSVSDTFGATQMIYSEKSDFSDAQYISFRQTAIYSLSSGYGTKRIYVKYKDAAGNESATYSSTINYTETVQETVVVPDVTPEETDPDVENPDIEDEGSIGDGVIVFALRLLDGNKNPLQNVTIKLVEANLEASTDVNGIAVFNEAPIGKQQLLGVYNNQEFLQEIEISDDNKVITIVLNNQGVSPIVVVGLVSVIALMGGVIFYLIKRKKITTN